MEALGAYLQTKLRRISLMKKIMIAALSLSLFAGSAVVFAQNDTATKATKKAHKTKKAKKTTATDTMSSPK